MALPLPPGLVPSEVAFLCEMELVTVSPRQAMEGIELLSGLTPYLKPPFTASVPLWLALLLKRQRRANIVPPPWLSVESLTNILDIEADKLTADILSPPPDLPEPSTTAPLEDDPYLHPDSLEPSSPFLLDSSTARAVPDALPYHWMELSHLLLTHAGDDIEDADAVRRLLRDLREVRMSKLRKGFGVLDAGQGVKINGVGGMEVAEVRGFVSGVMDGLRRIGRSGEEARKEREAEDRENGVRGSSYRDQDEDEDML